jgi:serine protease Do
MRQLILLFLAISVTPSAHAYDKAKLFDAFLSVVMIRGYNPDGSLAYGSGVVVAPNQVATNCHIFRQTKQPWVSRGEDSYYITSVKADRYRDLCLVTTTNLPLKAVEIVKHAELKKGQEIVAIGHSSGVPAPITSLGALKSLYPFKGGNILRSTARFAMGASGSGMFDAEGRLLGINTFKTPGRNAYFYALPISWLDDLEKLPAETTFPIDGMAFWEEEDANKPYFMQIAVPELQEDWLKLAQVAERWTKAEPGSTEAWYELGNAQEHLGREAEAEAAYRKSIELQASNTDSLFRLGVMASQKGDTAQVDSINNTLLALNKDIAEEFNKAIKCKDQCKN